MARPRKTTKPMHLHLKPELHAELMRFHEISGGSAAAFVVSILADNLANIRAMNDALEIAKSALPSVRANALAPLVAALNTAATNASELAASIEGASVPVIYVEPVAGGWSVKYVLDGVEMSGGFFPDEHDAREHADWLTDTWQQEQNA